MGDIADAMIEGLFCQLCGGYIDGDEPGYPRYCSDECKNIHETGTPHNRTKDELDAHSVAVKERKAEHRRAKRKRKRARKTERLAEAKAEKLKAEEE